MYGVYSVRCIFQLCIHSPNQIGNIFVLIMKHKSNDIVLRI